MHTSIERDVDVCCSLYCGENSAGEQTVQTERRRQIRLPASSTSGTVTVQHHQPSPTKSVVSGHSDDSFNSQATPAVMTSGCVVDDGGECEEETTRTWPDKRSGRRHHQPLLNGDNDRARLAGNQEGQPNDSDRLASQHECKSVETVFASRSADEPQYDAAATETSFETEAARVAEELLAASTTVQRTIVSSNQYSVDQSSTASCYSPIDKPVCKFYKVASPSVYPYSSSSLSSPYDVTQSGGSPVLTAADGDRRAVDVLFDNLFQSSSGHKDSDAVSPASVRTFPASPHLHVHSPQVQPYRPGNELLSHAADLAAAEHSSHITSPVSDRALNSGR